MIPTISRPTQIHPLLNYPGLPCALRSVPAAASRIRFATSRTNNFIPPKQAGVTISRRSIATFTPPYQAQAISTIQTVIDPSSDDFKENQRAMDEAMARLTELTRKVQEGGPPEARAKHIARKKMLPRDRITALIDPGTTFMELSPLAGHEMYPEAEVPAAGIITGIGVVEGVNCVIVANDSTVKGGTYYPITVKKHLRAQAVAQENKLP